MQEKLSFLPDYDFKKSEEEKEGKPEAAKAGDQGESWPAVSAGKSLAGILGGALTLIMAGAIGLGLRRYYSPGKG
jgi:cobalt/nickel transport system permease protein